MANRNLLDDRISHSLKRPWKRREGEGFRRRSRHIWWIIRRASVDFQLENIILYVEAKLTLPLWPSESATARMFSKVFIAIALFFLRVTLRFRIANILRPLAAWNRSFTWAFTSFSLAILGSWMKAPPLVFGGWSPVVAYLRHSIIVYVHMNRVSEMSSLLDSQSSRYHCGRQWLLLDCRNQ